VEGVMLYQVAIYNKWTGEYVGTVNYSAGNPIVFDCLETAEAYARCENNYDGAYNRYEACEHHEATQ
jgi:hypothetical protein